MVRRLLTALKGEEARAWGWLLSGSVIAQVLLLATLPILSRLYAPSAWGQLAALLTVSIVGGAVSSFGFDSAVVVARSERSARSIYAASLWLSPIGALLCVGVVAIIAAYFPGALGGPLDIGFATACFIGVLAQTHFNILSAALSRQKRYGPIAASKVNQTLLPNVAQIALAFSIWSPMGLVFGRIAGMAAMVAVLCLALPSGYRPGDALSQRPRLLLAAVRRHLDFVWMVPRQLLVRSATAFPPLLVVGGFGAHAGGLFLLAQRLVDRPGMLLSDALMRIPLRRFAEIERAGRPLLPPVAAYTGLIAIPVVAATGLIALAAHPLISFLFGERWSPAADFVVALAVWASARLIALPITSLIIVLHLQKPMLIIDAIFAWRLLAIPVLAAVGRTALEAVLAFVLLSVLYHLVTAAIVVGAARAHDRTLLMEERIS